MGEEGLVNTRVSRIIGFGSVTGNADAEYGISLLDVILHVRNDDKRGVAVSQVRL